MLVLWPLMLIGAAVLVRKSRQRALGRRGWPWFAAWAFAGALFMFSLLAGLSIGVFLLPAVAFAVLWLAVNAPYSRELAGFVVGVALVLPLIWV